MGDCDEDSQDMFYRRNYEQLMGWQDAGRVTIAAE